MSWMHVCHGNLFSFLVAKKMGTASQFHALKALAVRFTGNERPY